jgi:hypothetical protein
VVSKEAKTDAKAADKLVTTGDYTGAAKAYADAFAKYPNDAALLYAQGQSLRLAGEAAKAKEALDAYLKAVAALEAAAAAPGPDGKVPAKPKVAPAAKFKVEAEAGAKDCAL